jgi:hypothetical protein
MSLTIIKPLAVTPAMLTTNVPEDDYPAWAAGTTYAADARVIYEHKVYQSLQAANTGKTPSTMAAWWVEVGPTNRWAGFDFSHSTKVRYPTSMFFEVAQGAYPVNAVALLEIEAMRSVRVRLTHPDYGTVYDKTTSLYSIPQESSWYQWFFGERIEQVNFYALDLPTYPGATVRIDCEGIASMAVGVILLGDQKRIGEGVQRGVRMGIRDYSRKEVNQWGDVVLQQRAYSKTRSIQVLLKNDEVDGVDRLLSSLRSTPLLWIIGKQLQSPNVYGWYGSFEILIAYAQHSECSIDIEGFT